MKRFAIVFILVAFVLSIAGSVGDALPPGPSRLTLQAYLISTVKASPIITVRTYSLYNRPAYKKRLGTGVSSCTTATKQWEICRIYAHLSRGEIIGDALTTISTTFTTFAVLGGTGVYSNIGGTITVQQVGGTVYLIIGTLEGL